MDVFSKNHTNFVKCAAALLLLFHHLFFHNFSFTMYEMGAWQLLTAATKVCVALFSLLSGYGLAISYSNKRVSDGKFVFTHLKKLLVNYWWVYIPVFILAFWINAAGTPIEIYGTGIKGVLNGFIDFVGLRGMFYTPTLTNTWWFVSAVFVYYLFFPIIYKCCKKSSVITIIAAAVPCVLKIFFAFLNTSDRELFYLLPFVVGVVFAQKNTLDKFVAYSGKHKLKALLISGIFVLCSLPLSFVSIGSNMAIRLLGNTVYACAITLFCISVKSLNIKLINAPAEYIGKYSMDIYYIRPFIYSVATFKVLGDLIQAMPNSILKYIALIIVVLAVSVLLETVKKYFYKGVSHLSKREKSLSR